MSPYQPPTNDIHEENASEILRSHPSVRSVLAMFVWFAGTFLFSLLIIFDILIGEKLPGGTIYVAFLVGPILGALGAVASKYKMRTIIGLITVTVCLVPIQFVVVGIVLLATTGFDGIQ